MAFKARLVLRLQDQAADLHSCSTVAWAEQLCFGDVGRLCRRKSDMGAFTMAVRMTT